MMTLFNGNPPVQTKLGLTDAPRVRSFTEAYRPTTLAEVFGQDAVVASLRGFLTAPYPCALLLSGPTGTGKTSTALALMHDMGIDEASNFFHIKSGAMDGAATEDIIGTLRFTPWAGGWRMILIDEADQWTPKSRQLWLSALEQLPSRTVIVFTSNHPERFDQRTLDRFEHLRFSADAELGVAAAQRLADHIWHSETGGADGPDVSTLPDIVVNGEVSYRRLVSTMQAVVRDGRALPPVPPTVLMELAPTLDVATLMMAPVCGGAPQGEEIPPRPDFSEPLPPAESARPKRVRRTKAQMDHDGTMEAVGFALMAGNDGVWFDELRPGTLLASHERTMTKLYVVAWVNAEGKGVDLIPFDDYTTTILLAYDDLAWLNRMTVVRTDGTGRRRPDRPGTVQDDNVVYSATQGNEPVSLEHIRPGDHFAYHMDDRSIFYAVDAVDVDEYGIHRGFTLRYPNDPETKPTYWARADLRSLIGTAATFIRRGPDPAPTPLEDFSGSTPGTELAIVADPAPTPLEGFSGPLDLASVPRDDLYALWIGSLAPATLRAYRADLEDFAAWAQRGGPEAAVSWLFALPAGAANGIVFRYRTVLETRQLGTATIARRLASLKSLGKLARMLGICAWVIEVPAPVPDRLRDTSGPGSIGWQAMKTAAAGDPSPRGFRDLAIITLGHDLGCRRGEIVGLDLEHVERAGGLPTAVWVLGKGRSSRERMTLPPPTARALGAWINTRGPEAGPLFHRLDDAADASDLGRLSGEGVRLICKRLSAHAGLDRVARPHGLRHQGITAAWQATKDPLAVKRFARHSKFETTERYIDNAEDTAGRLAALIAGE